LILEKTILDDHQAQITVEVDSERVQAARQRAARKIASRGKIPGFRPGKAPYDVILRHYGDEAVYEQAVDLLVDEVYPEMLKEADIKPGAAGSLEKVDGTDHPKFTFKVPLSPVATLGDYHAIRMPYDVPSPGPGKLDEAIEELRQAYGTTQTVEREIADGDYAVVDIKSPTKSLERTGFACIVRAADRPDGFPFAGFAQALLGLKAGDVKTVQHTYPQDGSLEELAGQSVELEVKIKSVRSITLPTLDDEFAKMVGQYDSLAALQDAVGKEIQARVRADYDNEYYAQLIEKIREDAAIKYAPQTLEHEAEHVVDDMRRRLAQQGLDLETYYKMRSTDASKFMDEEAKPVAKKRLERSLILDEISRLEKIEVDNSSLDEEFSNTLVDLQSQGVNLNSIRGGKQGQQRVAEALAMESANRLLTRRTLERLRSIATGEYSADVPALQIAGEAGAETSKAQKQAEGGRGAGKTSPSKASKKASSARQSKPTARKSSTKK
jgi:trigger factor